MQSNSEMLASERRSRLLGMASTLRADLARNPYPDLTDKQRRACLERCERWETEAKEIQS